MATAGSIVVDLLMRTGSFETDSKRAEKRLRELQKTAVSAGKAIGVGLAAVATGAAVMAKQAIDAADDMDELAQKAGVSVEALSRLDYAAKISGVDIDTLSGGITKLTKFMVDSADAGSEQARIFEALGVEAMDATGGLRGADEVLKDLAGVFDDLPDGAEKTALAIKVFGKSGAELIPLLNQGADGLAKFAEKSDLVGYTLDTHTGKAAGDFNEKLDELGLSVDGLWRETLPSLLPKLEEFAELLNSDDFRNGFGTIISGAATAIGWLGKLATTTANVTSFLGEEIAARVAGPSLDDPVRIQQAIDRQQRLIDQLDQKGTGAERRNTSTYATEQRAELKRLQDMLALGQEMAVEGATRAAQIAKLAGEAPEIKVPTLAGLGLLDTEDSKGKKGSKAREREPRDLMADFLKDDREELERQIATTVTAQEQLDQLAAIYAGPLAEAEHDHAQRLREITELGTLAGASSEDIAKLKEQEAIAFGKTTDEILAQQKALEQLGQVDYVDNVRDSVQGLFYDLKEGVGVWDSLTNAVNRFGDRLFDIASDGLIDQLFGKRGTGGGGDYGDLIGGFFSTFFGGAKAGGGDVFGDRAYLVGEQGPEMFVPRTAGKIVPAGDTAMAMGGGGAGLTQVNNFNYQAPYDARTEEQKSAQLGFATRDALRSIGA